MKLTDVESMNVDPSDNSLEFEASQEPASQPLDVDLMSDAQILMSIVNGPTPAVDAGLSQESLMGTMEFFEALRSAVEPTPVSAAEASAVDPIESMESMEVEPPPSEFQDPQMEKFSGLIRDRRPEVDTKDRREAREKAVKEEEQRKQKELARRALDKDTPYGVAILADIMRTDQRTNKLGIPGFENIGDIELMRLIENRCTIVGYTTASDEYVTCSLSDLPPGVDRDDTVPVFTIRKYQTEAAIKVFKNLLNHRMSLLTFGVGLGKTVTALAAAIQMVKLNLANNVVIVSPNTLTEQWHDAIKEIAGSDHEIFFVNCDTIKKLGHLLYEISQSKAALVFLIVSSSLLNDEGNIEALKEIFELEEDVVLDDEGHLLRRDPRKFPTSIYRKIFGGMRGKIGISATPLISGVPGKEETSAIAARGLEFDTRPAAETRCAQPRQNIKVDPRGCSAVQLQKIVKALSVDTPGDANLSPPRGAIYKIMVNPTAKADGPRMELFSHGLPWGENNRFLAAARFTLQSHLLQKGLEGEGKIKKARNVCLMADNVTALNDMAENFRNLGYGNNVVVVHGQLSKAVCDENVRRMLNEFGLIVLVTPGKCACGLNMQYTCSTLIFVCKNYTEHTDLQALGRINRFGQTEIPMAFFFFSGDDDKHVADLANAKMEATAAYYDHNPNTKVPWSREPIRSITDAEIRAVVHGLHAAAQGGFTVNLQCAAPLHNSKLLPPATDEDHARLKTHLRSWVCPEVTPPVPLQGFEVYE